jgi:predicted  nucleic acid-binding Zn-ribbon protein
MYKGVKIAATSLLVVLTGCATSSDVQELIDASHQDYLEKSAQYDASINVLRKSATAALTENRAQAKELEKLRRELEEANATIEVLQGNAEAAKVMSAANTVKVADLEITSTDAQKALAMNIARMMTVDEVYKNVMLNHFQQIADNANAAIADLKIGLEPPSTQAAKKPVAIAEPLEIVAPDTSAQ